MLNELIDVHQALAEAGVPVSPRHPSIKGVGNRATLHVRLRADGSVWNVDPLSANEAANLWTLRDGQHNSFPYHQIKNPLLRIPPDDSRLEVIRSKRTDDGKRWASLLGVAENAEFNDSAFEGWPGGGYRNRLRERVEQLAVLTGSPAGAVPASFQRFLRATEEPAALLRGIVDLLLEGLRRGRITTELPLLVGLLTEGGGALYFGVDRDFDRSVGDQRNVDSISDALRGGSGAQAGGLCSLTGERGRLVTDLFPQPNLPILGQTYLFARNRDAPTNSRYGHASVDTVAVGSEAASALQAAIEAITKDEWKDRTWRSIPGEKPKQFDLFVAFVPGPEEVPLAALLSEEAKPELRSEPGAHERFASFSERLTEAFKGRLKERAQTQLSLLVLRKLDPANRKAVYSRSLDVATLEEAARRWSAGCANIPSTIHLRMPGDRGEPAHANRPRDIAPLSLIPLSKKKFIGRGFEVLEVMGRTADEAMRLFLTPMATLKPLTRTVLKHSIGNRRQLLEGFGHAQSRSKKEMDAIKPEIRREVLDTVTLFGLLLYQLGRTKEVYMEEVAFKVGRLLAAADTLHAGYNAHVRAGAKLPPRLMGNAVLPMAQSDPVHALNVLLRRWPVYQAWAQREAGFRVPRTDLGTETDPKTHAENARAWQIRRGITAARRAQQLAMDLAGKLPRRSDVDDRFRAELLLGYIAGPPRGDEMEMRDREASSTPTQGDE